MKNKILLFFCLVILFSFNLVNAESCSKNGYTILTINGIFTDEKEANYNKRSLEDKFLKFYNNQPVVVDYVYNPTHIGGLGDLVDVARQGLFDPKSDYDLVEMLDDASEKVGTQKLLIVGHSQGNFYANNFYDKVADIDGGIPSQSIGVYGVASPDKRVAGGGKYLTSDTDKVIAVVVGRLKNILSPNTHIELKPEDGNGHSFSDVYLKYRSKEIVSDIKSSLDKLQSNSIQDVNTRCISPQKISMLHKVTGVLLAMEDYTVGNSIKGMLATAGTINTAVKSLANTFLNLGKKSLAMVGLYDSGNTEPVVVSADDGVSREVINETENNNPESVLIDNNTSQDAQGEIIKNPEITNPKIEEDTRSIHNYSGGGSITENTEDVKDVTPPIITLNGESTININLNGEYIDQGAVAKDDIDTEVAIIKTGEVDTTKLGVYTITYNATDTSLNKATPVTRTVNVINDPTIDNPPIIKLNGESSIFIEINGTYTEEGAVATDDHDGDVPVEISGLVDTSSVGDYMVTYKASDKNSHTSSITRNIKVGNSNPVVSTTSKINFPTSDYLYDDNGRYPDRGKMITPINFRIVYTDINNKPASSIKIQMRNIDTGAKLEDIELAHVSYGFGSLSDGDYTNGEMYEVTRTFDVGNYRYSIIAFDKSGNFFKIEESNYLELVIFPFTYTYVPKYSFGTGNGDGNDWQVWGFEGSNIYDWKDLYVNNYLREEFKIQTYSGGSWCSDCMERGIFYHNPLIGFDQADYITRSLDGTVQNAGVDRVYQMVIQWNESGYSYVVFHDNIIDATGVLDFSQSTKEWWTGWDTFSNGFHRFPSGGWVGHLNKFPTGMQGGFNMLLQPYPVYDKNAPDGIPTPTPIPIPKSSEKKIISFSFNSLNPKVDGVVDENTHTISLTVPFGTDLKNLTQAVIVSEKAIVNPHHSVIQDFTKPVIYTVIAEDDSNQSYTVNVSVAPNPNPPIDPNENALPTITSYSLNGLQENLTINPLTENPTISLTSNKNVNWLTIKIESEEDSGVYKTLQSNGTTCKDGTNTCSKIWEGDTSKGLLKNGSYKINIHTKDSNNNEYTGILPIKITVIGQTL